MFLLYVINSAEIIFRFLDLLISRLARFLFLRSEKVALKIKTESYHDKKWMMIIIPALLFINVDNSAAQVNYKYGFTIGTGIYAADGFGSNFSAAMRINRYFNQGKHFLEASLGISNLNSGVLRAIGSNGFFKNNRLFSIEFLYGYDPKMWTSLPYFTIGVANVNQGGQNNYAGVLGIGNRLHFNTIFGSKKIGLRYDLRDHIFKQSFNAGESFIAHNLNFSLNLEFFF